MLEVRNAVLDDLRKHLEAGPAKEVLWTVSSIGHRTPQITGLLWPLLGGHSDLADTALATLAGLGAAPTDRDRLLDLVRNRLSAGEFTHGVRVAVHELVGPHRIELATDLLRLAALKHPGEDHVHFSLAVTAATRAVDRSADNARAQDEVWAVLRSHFKTVRQTDEYAYGCDTKATVIDYVNWLLTEEWAGDGEIGPYIMLSRLHELAKPRQLKGWDEIPNAGLTGLLERLAKKDTEMTGQYATTRSRLKVEAWETALTIGCPRMEDWIGAAVLDETNPCVAHDVAEIASSLRFERLPNRLLDAIVGTTMADDDNGRFFRQNGLIDIARSSCSRAAYESILRFQLTHEGHVLFSTIDAIVDIAIARLQEGDSNVVERLLEMTIAGNEQRHREAGVSAFCQLCSRGFVHGKRLSRLWHFANANDLDDFWRCRALEAIGLTDFEEASAWIDSVRQIAERDETELGWRACEVLIRRKWIADVGEQPLFARLGLIVTDGQAKINDPTRVNEWQAFLIGLLFRGNKDRFGDAVSDVLAHGPADAVHQFLNSVRSHGDGCPDPVSLALVRRIRESNDKAAADTELFSVLATIAPSRLLTLSGMSEWTGWLVEARAALCEAIRSVAADRETLRTNAVDCLVAFMQDAAFQVRRSAYRAVALWDGSRLESICAAWSQSNDVELRKRAG